MIVFKPEVYFLLELIGSVLKKSKAPELPAKLDFNAFYKLSQKHILSNIVYFGLKDVKGVPAEVLKPFYEIYKIGLLREATQTYEMELILKKFELEKIRSMPLKGYILKSLYPYPDLRSMADLDILVENEKFGSAAQIVLEMGYCTAHTGSHHDTFHKPPTMNVELHRSLVGEKDGKLFDYYNNIWEKALPCKGRSYICELSREDQYIYLLAHTAKHYAAGGCGIRAIMDIYLYLDRYGTSIDMPYIERELAKMGILGFARKVQQLSKIWFMGEKSNDEYDKMTAFIISGAAYGSVKNSSMMSMAKLEEHRRPFLYAKIWHIAKLLFLPYKDMAEIYNTLKKRPFLLPWFWLYRIVRSGLFRRAQVKAYLSNAASVKKDQLGIVSDLNIFDSENNERSGD